VSSADRRPAAKAAKKTAAKAKASVPAPRAVPAPRPAPASAGPALGERAERLRDEILQSKLTHPDPGRYAAKARAWGERAQVLVGQIAVQGDNPSIRQSLDTLDGEVRGDHDFREARRFF
jgi:hypothetical protein